MPQHEGDLIRPEVSEADAVQIAQECYGIAAEASELGSNQDRNFVLTEHHGSRSVLRIDNPIFTEQARQAQHAALDAYRAAGMTVPAVLPGLNGQLTQHWGGFAVRRSEFADGQPMLECGYLAPIVVREFGALAADSVRALAQLKHPGLDQNQMWDMRVAYAETVRLAPATSDAELRQQVLDAAHAAAALLQPWQGKLQVQAIHGDLSDDNVMGVRGDDARLHPRTVLDLGDLSYGWRVAELAVTVSSLLHHEADRPWRVLDAVQAFHERVPLHEAEARALWPLVVLRACMLVASGSRQLMIDVGNEYAADRIATERAIFAAATALPLVELIELVVDRLGVAGPDQVQATHQAAATSLAAHTDTVEPLRALLPGLSGAVRLLDLGVESEALDAGRWLAADAEQRLVDEAFAQGAAAVVCSYGEYRLSRSRVDTAEPAAVWAADTEIRVADGQTLTVASPVAAEVATVCADGVTLKGGDLAAGERLIVSGFTPQLSPGTSLPAGAVMGTLAAAHGPDEHPRQVVVGLRRLDAPDESRLPGAPPRPLLITPERVPAWRRFSGDPAQILGLPARAQHDQAAAEQRRRERIFAKAQERYYEQPMQVQRGWRHHLIDTTGLSYVDMVNNVTGLGHGHPGVADAVNRQIRVLNTNSRFLYRELAEYSERLLALMPAGSGFDTVLLVNSGSEAVDLALRLVKAATGRRTIVALREAYHGWTMASDAVTTSASDNPYALHSRPDWVHIADVPNWFRGSYRGEGDDPSIGAAYARDLAADLLSLARSGREVAGFICEPVLGNAGGVLLPDGYLAEAYRLVREAGGLAIADEVQLGFGRIGSSFWGFERSGVIPDLVTIAKPMGNGFPIGAVITSQQIADALADQGQFFSSAGGNPLSCRVGLAVLDAMRDEDLQTNARAVGKRLAQGLRELAKRHRLIGAIHGEGLYLGVELVQDRDTLQPAKAEAAALCERLKELGVIVTTTSERSNVLKMKPPLCLTAASADFVVAQLDRVLCEGW